MYSTGLVVLILWISELDCEIAHYYYTADEGVVAKAAGPDSSTLTANSAISDIARASGKLISSIVNADHNKEASQNRLNGATELVVQPETLPLLTAYRRLNVMNPLTPYYLPYNYYRFHPVLTRSQRVALDLAHMHPNQRRVPVAPPPTSVVYNTENTQNPLYTVQQQTVQKYTPSKRLQTVHKNTIEKKQDVGCTVCKAVFTLLSNFLLGAKPATRFEVNEAIQVSSSFLLYSFKNALLHPVCGVSETREACDLLESKSDEIFTLTNVYNGEIQPLAFCQRLTTFCKSSKVNAQVEFLQYKK